MQEEVIGDADTFHAKSFKILPIYFDEWNFKWFKLKKMCAIFFLVQSTDDTEGGEKEKQRKTTPYNMLCRQGIRVYITHYTHNTINIRCSHFDRM